MRRYLKFVIVALVIIAGLILLISYFKFQYVDKEEQESVLKISIYPTGKFKGTYYFTLTSDNILSSSLGERRFQKNLTSSEYLRNVVEQKKNRITEQDYAQIITFVESVTEESHAEKYAVIDGLAISIHYNGMLYDFNYSGTENEDIDALAEKLRELSPIYP